jgi:hypothetical protein
MGGVKELFVSNAFLNLYVSSIKGSREKFELRITYEIIIRVKQSRVKCSLK